ncbi:uncharacterized protein LOC132646008 [Lycium barbarum]|uniref:uncharacterized protein LOC132646008 n=1 Tax=Lycium barbarum TaxID=112863 RepID=UPI00293E05A3|nr:uncharacterized protein LOC132646008 [Lycium barbarum]XP_060167233.1 uncharacterized protein LOC132646008 [Lycium barbarum]XP_060167234.1 uncharacterized protein LOC132646008 [Lycium barbarum]
MARGGRVGRKTNDRRKAGSMYRGSDQSDEDYTVDDDEEFDESEDGYSSFVGDESEGSLGEYEVKRVVRSRAPSRNKKGTVKHRKRKRVSYREDDDEDDGVDEDDEEFTPDCLDEEEEFPVKKGTNNSSKRRSRKGTVKDEDDEEFTPYSLDEEEEFPVTKRMNNSSKRRLRTGTVKDEDEDDEEFTLDCLDEEEEEEEEFPVTERTNNSSKRRSRKGTVKDEEDEDDEELNLDGLDEEEDFPVMKGMKNSSRSRRRKGTAKDDDEYDDEDDEDLNLDVLDGEEDFPITIGMNNSSRPQRRKGPARDDDEDDDEEDKDDEEFTPDSLDEEEDMPVTKGMKNSSKPRLCKGTAKDDDEEEDDDDEEFTPDGLDEEEEFPVMERIKYSSKPRLRRKGIAREQKRNRNHKELKKITRKKPQKRRRLKRKARSEIDEEFIDVDPLTEEKNKKSAGQRRKRKRLTLDSDSDFIANSGSSDREFTISEEEREQVREASKFCRNLVRGSVSLKHSPREEAPRLQRKHPGRKAKAKVEELKTEPGKQICGICLSEEGKRTVRGTLNCCSHYFCFACIMEWSKVESRCPLCKQRFVTISKPARSDTGFDLRTVVIQVPERDQVYQPSEEELRGYLDPYENVLCTECQQGGDDALMLLCDLCDSPAHTYCVGLGHEVPEGNWYCESCRPTVLASSNPQNLNPMPDNRTSTNFSVGSPPVANVREMFDLNEMYVPDTPLAEDSGEFQSPRDGQVSPLASGIGAFTVSDRRRIQRQIHQLLHNRRRQLGNSLVGSQIARSRELATQPAVAQRAAPHNTFFQGRQPESNARLPQNRNLAPERLSNLSGQLNLNGASTSSQSFFGEFLESELQGTEASFGFGLAHQQLHPCSSRSNAGPDTSNSPCQFREPTVPTRTLPSTLRRPF